MDLDRVQSSSGVTLVGPSDPSAEDVDAALKLAPCLVAADGGADVLLALGLSPDAVIGDLDSLSGAGRAALGAARILHVAEQTSTDFEKCLARIDAPFVLAAGFTGRRADHTLAALSVLVRRVGPPTLVLSSDDVIFAVPEGQTRFDLATGARVSLYPLAPVAGRSTGLEWPIDGLTLDPLGRVGTSNRATGPVTLDIGGPGLLALLPRADLDAALKGLGLA